MRTSLFYSALLYLLFVQATCAGNPRGTKEGTGHWEAGVARKVITPEYTMWLAGYARRTEPSQGKLHDLWAKALVIKDEQGNQAVLVTTDLLGMTRELSHRIKSRLKDKHGLSVDQVLINSSHTHSGPVLENSAFDMYPLEDHELDKIEKYTSWLEEQILELVSEAYVSMEPVKIFAENGVTRFQVNRRSNSEKSLLEQTELKGPNDYAVPVMKVEDMSGQMKVIVFGYACHPTVLSHQLWSGDYPGFAQIELEKQYPGTLAMFLQGAGADQNPLPRHMVSLAQQYGRELAAAVDRVLHEQMRGLSPELITSYTETEVPFSGIPSRIELEEVMESGKDYEARWAARMLQKLEKGETFEKSYPVPLQYWQLGDQQIFAMGGEVVIEYAIKLKQLFGLNAFVFGYTNDVMSYITTAAMIEEGGYEVISSQRAFGLPAPWDPVIESLILTDFIELTEKTHRHAE
ncbi:MAG: neutral/alkaline non-lysosomal ceramidase N-terminal domain-containing protein [Bacteroidota bacterium]